MSGRRFWIGLGLVAAVALAGRVAYILTVTRHQQVPATLEGLPGAYRAFDELYYEGTAEQLADGVWFKSLHGDGGAEDAEHPPLTAFVLAPVAWVTDGSSLAMRLAVAVAGTGVVVLIGLVGREVAGRRAGLIAAALAAVYPNLWLNDGLIMSETFTALSVAAALLAALRLRATGSIRWAAVTGAWCGAAMLTRGELALLVPLFAVPSALSLRDRPWRRRGSLAAVTVLTAMVVIAPWVAFNLARFERPVLLATTDGSALIGANCERTYYGDLLGFHDGFCGAPYAQGEASVAAARARAAAFRYVGDNLGRVPLVLAARFGRAWSLYRPTHAIDIGRSEGRPVVGSTIGLGMFWLLVPLAVAGAVVLRRRGTALAPLLAPAVIVTINALLFFGWVRHRVPAEVPLTVLAAVALDRFAGGEPARDAAIA